MTDRGDKAQRPDSLERARSSQQDAARPDAVARVHGQGRLTARERLAALMDPGTEVEYGGIAARSPEGNWIPEAGGVDFVCTINGQPAVVSSTDYTDHGGGYGAGRLGRLISLAREHRWPLVLFVDGGGSRARHPRAGNSDVELSGAIGRFTLFDGMAELSGWAPTVAIVSGPAFAGHASIAGFSDCLIATSGSSIGMGGPPMVEAALGKRLTAHELAGAEMHETGGGIDLLVDDEHAAIAVARRYLSYYRDLPTGGPAPSADPGAVVPTSGTYDVRSVAAALVDIDTLFELRPAFAPSVVTALARVEGRTIGVLANQPLVDDGWIDEDGATKITRFVELCDANEYPILALIDKPGCRTRREAKSGVVSSSTAVTRWHMRPILAHQHRTVPVFSVQLRRGGGLGPSLMGGFSTADRGLPALSLAWPGVALNDGGGFAAVRDANAFDDVVLPRETRPRIARVLRLVPRAVSAVSRPSKKHPIDTW